MFGSCKFGCKITIFSNNTYQTMVYFYKKTEFFYYNANNRDLHVDFPLISSLQYIHESFVGHSRIFVLHRRHKIFSLTTDYTDYMDFLLNFLKLSNDHRLLR